MGKRRASADSEPHLMMRDTGCEDGLIPSCLSCPLPRCRYEVESPGYATMWLAYWAVRWLTRKGLTMEQIAEQLHISVKTVYRMRHAVVIDGRIVYSVR